MFQRPFDAIASAVVPAVADAVDPDDLVDRIDVNALIDRIDVDAVLDRIDVNALIDRIDVDALLDRLDLDALIDRIDLDRLVGRIDVDAIVDRVDVDRVVTRVDLDAIVDQVDVERVVARVDLDAAVARVDLDAAADRIDVDRVVARVDVDAIAASLDIDAIVAESTKGVLGRFTDLLRRQVVGVDEIAMRATNRLLRRDYASLPTGPPLVAASEPVDAGGATMSGRYAGPVSRIGALGLDLFLISSTFTLLLAGLVYLLDVLFGATLEPGGGWVPASLIVLYGFTYFWLSQALTGRTISQALVGVKVISNDGRPLRPGAAAIRTLVLPFSFLLFGAGALMALVDRRRRALHDVAAKSAVVYDWGDRPAALPAPITRFLDRKEASPAAALAPRSPQRPSGFES
ncbi:MAG TPA: RDD family protein [Ilumatobacteraceae bacterium]|nr:RDD family protein [Ilumatobacteraceae bacterium]